MNNREKTGKEKGHYWYMTTSDLQKMRIRIKKPIKQTNTRIRQGFDLTSWGELSYILRIILGRLLVLKVLSQLPASKDQPLLEVSESSV